MPEEKYLGRMVKEKHTFKVEGTFKSINAARRWLYENGYNEGSMSKNNPIGIVKGQYNLTQKWPNMYPSEKAELDGVIVSNDFREGEVIVYIFN